MAPGSIRMETPANPFEIGNWTTVLLCQSFADHLSHRFLKRELECRQFLPGCVGIGHIVCEASVGGGITSSHAVFE
jgi:hypothetical protein